MEHIQFRELLGASQCEAMVAVIRRLSGTGLRIIDTDGHLFVEGGASAVLSEDQLKNIPEQKGIQTLDNELYEIAMPIKAMDHVRAWVILGPLQQLCDNLNPSAERWHALEAGLDPNETMDQLANAPALTANQVTNLTEFLHELAKAMSCMAESSLRDIISERERKQTAKQTDFMMAELETATLRANRLTVEAFSAQKSKDEFLGNISYELRTSMNNILGLSRLLLTTTLDREQLEYTRAINSSGEELLEVVGNLIKLSDIKNDVSKLDYHEFSLEKLLDNVVEENLDKARLKGLSLRWVAINNLPKRVNGDAGRLHNILHVLVGNAIKYTDKGQIGIALRLEDHTFGSWQLKVAVTDTGIGIPAEKLCNLFGPYRQITPAAYGRHEDSGLGLAVCQELVELMGGSISATSCDETGTTFRFEILLKKVQHLATGVYPPGSVRKAAPRSPVA